MTPLFRAGFILLSALGATVSCRPTEPGPGAEGTVTLDWARGSGPGEWRPDRRVRVGADGRVEVTRHHWRVDYMKSTVADSAPSTATLRVDPARVGALLDRFERSGFFALDTAYLPRTPACEYFYTDMHSVRLTAAHRGRARTINFYDGCKGGARRAVATLLALANATDSLAGRETWTPRR